MGISSRYRLSPPAIVRYNPAQMLGHLLGQRWQTHGAENQPT
jgi:hypothetical protein